MPVDMTALILFLLAIFSNKMGLFESPDPILIKGTFSTSTKTSKDTGSIADAVNGIPTSLANAANIWYSSSENSKKRLCSPYEEPKL